MAFENWRPCTVPINSAISDGVPYGGHLTGGFFVPFNVTVSSVSYSVSADGGQTYGTLFNASGPVGQSVSPGRAYLLPPELQPFTHFRFVLSSLQAAARTIQIALK